MRYQTKGRFLLASFLIGVLAACAPATPAPQPTAPPAAQPTTPPAAEPTQAPQTKGKIKIATQSPLSGPQSALGVGIRNGADLGLRDMGKMLTDMGFEVELAPFDDQAKPEVGAANAKSIASDPDILCVVGHLNSGVALASLPTYSDNNLAMVSPANTNPKITESGYKNAFRVVGRDDVQGRRR
jgi:branched-chain amino acid transport system substrate-binding protein